jgi:prepilin-type N-terminal cleavage/methylation domain-containing protein
MKTILKNKGLTLIELSVVVALLLGLIAILFYGIASFKANSDKARCKMKIAQIQKGLRAFGNFNNVEPTAAWGSGPDTTLTLAKYTTPLLASDPTALNCPADNSKLNGAVAAAGNPAIGVPGYNHTAKVTGSGSALSHNIALDADIKNW